MRTPAAAPSALPGIRPVLILTAGLWTMAFLLFTGRVVLIGELDPVQLPARVLNAVLGALLCGGLYAVLRAQARRPLWLQMAIAVLGSIALGLLYAVLTPQILMLSSPNPTQPSPGLVSLISMNGPVFPWLFLSWCCGYLALAYSESSRASEIRMLQAEALASDAQNRMLRYQINPHFLFNTLNTLSSFVLEKKNAKAEEVLLSLAEFLRYSLARSPEDKVPLSEEARAQEEYLHIEQARFGPRMRFVRRIEPEAAGVLVPSLILQPLVENAVKYAVSASSQPVTITLAARRDGDRAEIEVRDDGPGVAGSKRSGLGVGLENVRRRLELAYGERVRFSHGVVTPRGYAVHISIPAE